MDVHPGGPDGAAGSGQGAEEPLVGRDAESARLFRAVDLASASTSVSASAESVVVVAGEPGMGRSALLEHVARRAAAGGARVLRAVGSESESGLAFAALHQVLRPVRHEVDGLPGAQRAAVRAAFGMGPDTGVRASAAGPLTSASATAPAPRRRTGSPDPMLLGLGVLGLLSAPGGRRPVLVVLDDAHWFDRASLEVLAFAARRLDGEPVTMLVAVRAGEQLPGFDGTVPALTLGPLDRTAAGRLLDRRPDGPAGRTRTRILDEADGNPQALVEFARAAAVRETAAGPPFAGPLPLTDRAARMLAARLNGLPVATTRALLLLSALDAPDPTSSLPASPLPPTALLPTALLPAALLPAALPSTGLSPTADSRATGGPRITGLPPAALPPAGLPTTASQAALPPATASQSPLPATALPQPATNPAPAELPAPEDEPWLPAEQAGLIRRTGDDVRFRHPLVRSAVYHSAAPSARREAHLTLAGLLRDEPDRRARHLAAAATGPDAAVSAELERSAGRARRRGGHAAAAEALRRAAELAPRRADSARLLVEAAGAAVFTGDLPWVEELTAAARARTDDSALLARASAQAGRLAALTVRHSAVFPRLADAAEAMAVTRPGAALDLLADAAVVRYYSGRDDHRRRVQDILRRLPADPRITHAGPPVWIRTVADPFDGRDALVSLLPALTTWAGAAPERLTMVGIMAWLLDETPRAVRAFDEAFDRWEVQGALPEGLGGAIAWAYVERGRWEQALAACARTTVVGRAAGLDHAVACAAAVSATVLAFQGDVAAARARAGAALAAIDPLESRSVAVFARRALGAAAVAEGAYETAYEQFRMVFDADGAPVHYHASYPAVAELAAAAVRCGRREEAVQVVERTARALGDDASPRLRALLSRARGLLADPGDPAGAEPHFRAALADPVLAHWPFERAQTLLELAEWLRRRRRIAEARGPLAEALEVFRRLGAEPWAARARAEARAAGLDTTDAATGAGPATGTSAAADALAGLSPQQREIVELAARGLTNREIGEKLFLSPRTVGSHLYRSFPKLGVTARSQLRDLLEGPLRDRD
ncbi:AAA family ATPase [Streptomyces sp. NPDC023723]|uniref:AAA family ATPase n=1 Tax=Streptomyces sp. NPDC023723 TaxID=3154323 RepID=UPI0033CD8D6A